MNFSAGAEWGQGKRNGGAPEWGEVGKGAQGKGQRYFIISLLLRKKRRLFLWEQNL